MEKSCPATGSKSKKGTRRPLVLTKDPEARETYLKWYFKVVEAFKEACAKYRFGDFTILFPPGTYRPPGLAIH